jgi:hypothetical protein
MFQRWIADSRSRARASVSWFGANVGEDVSDIIDNLNGVEVPA